MTQDKIICNLYDSLGALPAEDDFFRFSLYAPNAKSVSVIGDFNGWREEEGVLLKGESGVWSGVFRARPLQQYKFVIYTPFGEKIYKADPFARLSQTRGKTNSVIFSSGFSWSDGEYTSNRQELFDKPLNIYEMHLGSWKRKKEGGEYGYKELAPKIAKYAKSMGYTHVEFMPLCEYPLDDSWGYQVTGYFSPTSRYGDPDGLRYLINYLHLQGIGAIIDFVPAHFCRDDFGLSRFDGSYLYESEEETKRGHDQWGTNIFDYSKPYVVSFLISAALFWLSEFHFDGIRVDAVASMLYLDYGKKEGEWKPNQWGGKENLEAIAFLRHLCGEIKARFPHCILAAEESTSFYGITKNESEGGLGFKYKWNMGWMNDTLGYFQTPYQYRADNYNLLTFPSFYAFSERYILPLSHDEVVHGKKSLIDKQQGSYDEKFLSLKVLSMLQYAFPGKKLSFMGNELAQFIEWRFYGKLDWMLLDYPSHRRHKNFIKRLNFAYLSNPALYENDFDASCFDFIQAKDKGGVIAFIRKSAKQQMLCIFNPSQDYKKNYILPLSYGKWELVITSASNSLKYIKSENGKAVISLPPLSGAYYVKKD